VRSVEVETRTRGELKGLSLRVRVNVGFLRAFLLTFNAIIIIL